MTEDPEVCQTGLVMAERPRAVAMVSPMEALAAMTDAEFDARLLALRKGQDRLAQVKREIMVLDTDYGIIPNTPKPTLLQPGAEKLCNLYHLVPTLAWQTIIGDGVTAPHIRVLMTCSLHVGTEDGPVVGQGVGTANTWEKKYRYRDAQRLCPNCHQPAIIRGKEEYGGGWLCFAKRGGCGAKFKVGDPSIEGQVIGQIETPDPYDQENTVVKIAAKRSYIDATKRTTASSGLFTQDVEDMEPMVAEPRTQAEAPKPAASPASPLAGRATPAMWQRWHTIEDAVKDWNETHPENKVEIPKLDDKVSVEKMTEAATRLKADFEAAKLADAEHEMSGVEG